MNIKHLARREQLKHYREHKDEYQKRDREHSRAVLEQMADKRQAWLNYFNGK